MKHSEKFNAEWYDSHAYRQPECYKIERYRQLWDVFYKQANDAGSVLDIGCGIGAMLGDWPEPCPEKLVGIDFSSNAISYARTRYPEIEWRCMSFDSFMWKYDYEHYDVITLCEVLEHIEFDRELFWWAKAHARKLVIASVPYNDRNKGTSHTAIRYTPNVVRGRFGPVDVVEQPDERFLVFTADGTDG
jgi:2-polyprenyl-3-methyl-5-hydroxy-6-metoxy-1,4-benzoquinol methylase